jgi:2-C-methyl-D-erythritol 2,4-cyclodiphosphate synthase
MPPLFRVGHGYDVHAFSAGRPLWLGGVLFPDSPLGLAGHSDADVLLHALCDALLGAAGLADIGKYFPPSDSRHKDRPSIEFVEEVQSLLQESGWHVGNVDITVLAELPKIGPRADEMKAVIAAALQIAPEAVGIKATTNEGLGFVGRAEGICAHAVALIFREE